MAEVPPPLDADSFEAHARFVRSLARDLARDSDEADEVVSRTFAAAVEQRPRAGATLGGWFARVAQRVVSRLRRDEVRRAARERVAARDERVESLAADPASIAARTELIERVAAAFAALEEPYRTTLYRRFYDGLTPAQIATREGVPVETVRTRTRRGLQRLREQLDAAHDGKREEWRALAIAVATRGGAIVAFKLKVAAVAAAVVVVTAVSTWQAVRHEERDQVAVETAAARDLEGAPSPALVTTNGDAARTEAPAAPRRSTELIPFASGVVVDASGAPIEGVLVVPALVLERTDGIWQVSAFDVSSAAHDALATTAADGRFRVERAPTNLAGLEFFKPGLIVGEWFDFSQRPEENADHRVELTPAGRVHGRVVDSGGRPIEFAFVDVHPDPAKSAAPHIAAVAAGAPKYVRSEPWQSVLAVSDADGRFEIAAVHSVPCLCWISAAGYGRFHTQRRLVDADTELEIVLRRETAVLIDVRDAKTKAPVRRARALTYDPTGMRLEEVYLPYEEWLHREWDGKTHSPPGRLTIWCEGRIPDANSPVESRTLKIAVFAEGYRPAELSLPLKRASEPPHESLELEPREPVVSLAGTVLGTSAATLELRFDRPYSNPDVQNQPPLARTEVGADGRFAFHDLPPATYRLSGSAPGCAPIWCDVTAPCDDLTVQFTPLARLVACVVDSTGAPAPGEVVVLQSLDEQRAWQAVTGADGCARFEGLPTGTFDVLAHMPIRGESSKAPPRTTTSDQYLRDERITLVAGENGPIVLPKLEPHSVTLHFEFADGSAVADAKFVRLNDMRGPVNWVWHDPERLRALDWKTDGDGFVDIDLYPGTYEFAVVFGGIQAFAKFSVPRRDAGAVEIRLDVPNRFGVVKGRIVTSPGERPIAGWKVAAGPIRSHLWSEADVSSYFLTDAVTTDADGHFRIERCPAGPICVYARDPAREDVRGVPLDRVTNAQRCTDLPAGGEKEITLPIPSAESSELPTAQLDLDVTSADDGHPLPGVEVLVYGMIGDLEYCLLPRSLPTDAEGHLRQRFPVCERYRMSLNPPVVLRSDPNGGWKQREVDAFPQEGTVRLSVALERGGRIREH